MLQFSQTWVSRYAAHPASAATTTPFTKPASSEVRKRAGLAISLDFPCAGWLPRPAMRAPSLDERDSDRRPACGSVLVDHVLQFLFLSCNGNGLGALLCKAPGDRRTRPGAHSGDDGSPVFQFRGNTRYVWRKEIPYGFRPYLSMMATILPLTPPCFNFSRPSPISSNPISVTSGLRSPDAIIL